MPGFSYQIEEASFSIYIGTEVCYAFIQGCNRLLTIMLPTLLSEITKLEPKAGGEEHTG